MRLHIGPVPADPEFEPSSDRWHRLKEPEFGRLVVLALPLGVLLVASMLVAWSALARS
jgi:hypothetical protein